MADAELRDERINCPNLDSAAAARIAQRRGLDVIVPVRKQERHRGKPLEDLCTCLRSRETLQQLLENEPGSQDSFTPRKGVAEGEDLGARLRHIPPQCQRPDTRVDEQAHLRERSAL